MKVAELMTTDVVTVGPETTLKEAAAILSEKGISGLPVIDAEGSVIGVFSEGDVVFRESGGTAKRPSSLGSCCRLAPGIGS